MVAIYYVVFTVVFFSVANFPSQCSLINNLLFNDFYATSTPDTYPTTPEIIRSNGYPVEVHIIQSEDGYLLEYHRIPHAKKETAARYPYPVLLHHGLLTSSADWVINGPEKGLAYRMADAGYDVWLGNARGNTYSRRHISLSPSDERFWDFSFHEMGIYDIPAALDYILNTTHTKKLIYMGHSMGTTMFYVFGANRGEYSDKILIQISAAPIGAMPHTTTSARLIVPFANELAEIMKLYTKGAFLEHGELASILFDHVCGATLLNTNECLKFIIFSLVGEDNEQFNNTLIPLITSDIPAGISIKTVLHCAQLITSGGKFQQYDYGKTGNLRRYKSPIPPSYNVSRISIPMKFFYGENDLLANPTDTKILYQEVSKPMGLIMINYNKWNHLDFLWAIDINKYFNDMILDFVINVTTKSNFIMQSIEKALIERRQNPLHYAPLNETDFKNRVAQIPHLVKLVMEIANELKAYKDIGINLVEAGFGVF